MGLCVKCIYTEGSAIARQSNFVIIEAFAEITATLYVVHINAEPNRCQCIDTP